MTIIVPVPIAPLPVAPYIGDPEFDAHADAHVAALTPHREQVNAISEATYQNALDARDSATSANEAASAAAAIEAQTAILASTAAQAVGAQMWQPHPMFYGSGAVVWSPSNGQVYRARNVNSGVDPADDLAQEFWWLIGAALSPPIVFVTADTVARPGMHYVFLAPATLFLPFPGGLRDTVLITDLSMSSEAIVDPGDGKIRGQSGPMRLNVPRLKFQLVNSGNSGNGKGWI
ncbi:hypothetical protein SAMN04489707_102345 [Paenacidovorax caeni]|uniref:Uncharacterized protein n=1 Tax=Paenacidovorax caeni TaxID=343013 RepID=A0A1I7J8M5_9BURK|nr:hypothetical protein [Paenacidovorax caeni]SFU81569.1 hypothetical protein SAMN04489707_102345 [Paenacidovorax caeni]